MCSAEQFTESTVLVADQVSGDEEIPQGVTAVLTSDSPDLVSHVAVRARNVGVLFATCFDAEEYPHFKELADQFLALRVTPGGDVEYAEREATGRTAGCKPAGRTHASRLTPAVRLPRVG